MLESLLEFLNNLIHSQHPEPILPHSHDTRLVILSILIAILAAYVALDLSAQVTAKRGRTRYLWLGWGAVAMGTGIWSMHFVAMLGFRLPGLTMSYDIVLVIVSLLAAVAASGVALYLTSRPHVSWLRLGFGSLLMGAAIAGMHYIGMAAIRLQAIIHYETVPFVLSVLIAVCVSFVALLLQFRLRSAATRRVQLLKVLAAVVMGFAVAAMHYTGMWAAVFHVHLELPAHPPGSIEISVLGGAAIAAGAFVVLGISLLLSLADRRLTRLSYTQKFMLISTLFVLPLMAFYPLVSEQTTRIDQYGRKESYGNYYLHPLFHILEGAHRHQLKAEGYLDGIVTREELVELQTSIDEDVQELEQLDRQYGAELQLGTLAHVLSAQWQTLKFSSPNLSKPDLLFRHALFIAEIRKVIARVGDNSYLILDPDLDTYYMMDTVLLKLPESQSLLVQTMGLGEEIVTRQTITAAERTELIVLTSLLKSSVLAMNENVGRGLRANEAGTMVPLVETPLQAGVTATQGFLDFIDARLLEAESINVDAVEFVAVGEAALEANAALFDAASQALEIGVQARIDTLTNRLVAIATFGVAGAFVGFLVGLFTMRAISRPLNELAAATQLLGAGDLSTQVNVTTEDEVGKVGRAFNNMVESLRIAQQRAAERTRALALTTEVSRRLSTIIDRNQLVVEVVEQLRAAFNFYHVHIYLFDEQRENLLMMGGTGDAGRIMLSRGHTIPKGRGLVGRAADTNLTMLVPDVAKDANWLPNPLLPDTKAEVAVPISVGEHVLGVLDVQQNIVGGLQQEDAELIQSIANQVAIVLQNIRSYSEAQRKAEREALINTINQKILASTTVESALQIAARETGRALSATRTHVRLKPSAPNGSGTKALETS
ncbi:MAG TPA: MHYT domain-containing protein [Anaerolineales bacterium]|nr:MHYT domain-containing protein [Anaerolineales bacterium]